MTDPTGAVAVGPGATDGAPVALSDPADDAASGSPSSSFTPVAGVDTQKVTLNSGNVHGVSAGAAPSSTPLVPVASAAAAGRAVDPSGVPAEGVDAEEDVRREEGKALLDGGTFKMDAAAAGTGTAAVDGDGPDGPTDGEGDASGGSVTGGDDEAVFPSFSELRGAVEDLDAGLDDAIGAAASSLWSLATTTAGRLGASAPPSTRSVVSGWSSHLPAVPTQESLVNFTSSVRGALAESPLPKVSWPGRRAAADGAGSVGRGSGVGGRGGGEDSDRGVKGNDGSAGTVDGSGGDDDVSKGALPPISGPDAKSSELSRTSRAAVLASSGAVAVGELAPIYDVEAGVGDVVGSGNDGGAEADAPADGDAVVTPAAVAAAAAGEITRVSQSIAGLSNTLGVRAAGLWGNLAAWVPADDEDEADDADSAPPPNAAPLTRFQQRVAAIQGDPSTYTSPPPGGDAAVSAWKTAEKWSLDDHEDEAVGVLDMFPRVAAVYEEKVPGEIVEELFWARLFFRLSRLAADERRRVALLDGAGGGGKGAVGGGGEDGVDDDELAWSDDEEEEEAERAEAGGADAAPSTDAPAAADATAVEGTADMAVVADAAAPDSSGGDSGGGEGLAAPSAAATAAELGDSQPASRAAVPAAGRGSAKTPMVGSAAAASGPAGGDPPALPPSGAAAAPSDAAGTVLPPVDADDARDGWNNDDDDDDWE
ncbi:hypothetical protein MMPV_006498 [Pyropia vietnamensis]